VNTAPARAAELERRLAEFKGVEDAVVFSIGFMTMMGAISALTEPSDLVLSDELNHASIVEGCRLSRAEVLIYKHNDMRSLESRLASAAPSRHKLIVSDGVFSMKGDVADVPGIKRLADKYGAEVMIDDAHGTGVLGAHGRGTLEHFGLEGQIGLACGTFSKTLGTTGGFIATRKDVATFLRLNSRPFLFSASPPPSTMATVLACLDVMQEEPDLLERLRANTRIMKEGLIVSGFRIEETITPIIPVLIGDDELTFRLCGALEREGVLVNPVVPPAVPVEGSLVRVSVTADLSFEQIKIALVKFRLVGRELGMI
jgi:8-amino-7-oxononanoate synthase